MKYPDRTPAGALLTVHRGRRWTRITVDRWPIADASPEQAATALDLSTAAARHCIEAGKRGGVSCGSGRVIWSVLVPVADTAEALDALFDLERGQHRPARLLAAYYRTTTATHGTAVSPSTCAVRPPAAPSRRCTGSPSRR